MRARRIIKSIGIIGATGDLGSAFANYTLSQGCRVLCSIRPQSVNILRARVDYPGKKVRIFLGESTDLTNLNELLQNVDVLYNLSGMVGLNFSGRDCARVLAVNGLAQGIIAHQVRELGLEEALKIIYPSSQRVHLLLNREDVREWMDSAIAAFEGKVKQFANAEGVGHLLIEFAQHFIETCPIPGDFNVYEISKRLGELFVSRLNRHSIVRISSVYGPGCWPRGFLQRAIYARLRGEEREEANEQRDFIYIHDLSEILFALAENEDSRYRLFDGASGTSIDLERAFLHIKQQTPRYTGNIHFDTAKKTILRPDEAAARIIIGREFTDFAAGLKSTVEYFQSHFQPHEEAAYLSSLKFDQAEAYEFKEDESVNVRSTGRLLGHTSAEIQWRRIPHVVVLDVGASNFRIGVITPEGTLLDTPLTCVTPGPGQYPRVDLGELQALLVGLIVRSVNTVVERYPHLHLEHVAISLGAVVSNKGVVQNASILWHESARGFNLKEALETKMPSMAFTVVNDVSAAAWRYRHEERFCVVTVSTGLGNKVFSKHSTNSLMIDADRDGLGGEMGHVVVDVAAAAKSVLHARDIASKEVSLFAGSLLGRFTNNNASDIDVTVLGRAAKERDEFALHILADVCVPYCECGNIADLCSYSSGPGTLRMAQLMARAAPGEFAKSDLARMAKCDPENISTQDISAAAQAGDSFTLRVLERTTRYLAQRILQLSADLGLDKFIIIGGFAVGVGQPYLLALQQNIAALCHSSGFFTGWDAVRIHGLVRLGEKDGWDGLVGVGHVVQYLQSRYKVALKPVGERRLVIVDRDIPACGGNEVLVRIQYAGICATDVQIYTGERLGDPAVLGHECIAEVVEVGRKVSDVRVGDIITINPNNPLDPDDKIGHTGTREGVFGEFYKFPSDLISKGQIAALGMRPRPEDVLIEPLSCVVNAQELILDDLRGKKVLVVGAGLLGALHVMLARINGAEQILLANASQVRIDLLVKEGIISRENTVLTNEALPQWIKERTYGRGVDVVIIAVSRNKGLAVAQQAVLYVANGGTIVLFGGFTERDVFEVPTDQKVTCADIRRSRHKHSVRFGEKVVGFVGSRGAEQAHFRKAVAMVTSGEIELSKFITHVVSLEALPEVIEQLSIGRTVANSECIRAVVDMDLKGEAILSAAEHSYVQLLRAANAQKGQIPAANPYREIGFDGDSSRLGWVNPPEWVAIKTALDDVRTSRVFENKHTFIFCTTGGYADAIEGIKEGGGISSQHHLHVLKELDSWVIAELLSSIDDLSRTACIGISKSGATIETVQLMRMLRERFDAAGLDYRNHFLWLSDCSRAGASSRSGEDVIRDIDKAEWSDVGVYPLCIEGRTDMDALFAAPHSLAFLLPMALLINNDDVLLEAYYVQYLALRDTLLKQVFSAVEAAARKDAAYLLFNMGADLDRALGTWTGQLIQQALGSKREGFHTKVLMGAVSMSDEFVRVSFNVSEVAPWAVRQMLAMYALEIFVALLADRKGVNFVTHDAVNAYKLEMKHLLHTNIPEPRPIALPQLIERTRTYLRAAPTVKFIDVVWYQHLPNSERARLQNELSTEFPNVITTTFVGSHWNHHSYQATYLSQDRMLLVIGIDDGIPEIEGITAATIAENARILKAIGYATYHTLRNKALYFKLVNV